MTAQYIIKDYDELDSYLRNLQVKRVFVVCDSSFKYLRISDYFSDLDARLGIAAVFFSDFQPNPLYESVAKGVAEFMSSGCGMIIAIGGGSALDVAKCVKLFSGMDESVCFLDQPIQPNIIPLLAVPTTAGTGSEATRYAVIYYRGEKQSVASDSCIPSAVLFDSSVLNTLPDYQKKSTLLDAYCHSIEAFWSTNSTAESAKFAADAIGILNKNYFRYLNGDKSTHLNMLLASNLAGKAINITQTTAGHAMSYKLTSLYGISHGHAAALCVAALWPYMLKHIDCDCCVDKRGPEHLSQNFSDLANAFGFATPEQASGYFKHLVESLELAVPTTDYSQIELLVKSVNPVRLGNNPVLLNEQALRELYLQILK